MIRCEMIFLDTSFIVAFFNTKDKNYIQARTIIKETMEINPNTLFVYSDYIFDELITLLKKKHQPINQIMEIGENILNSNIWKRITLTNEHFLQTWEMCKAYEDKLWSFTDISSFILMKEMNIRFYLSYDKHFEQYGKVIQWDPKFLIDKIT